MDRQAKLILNKNPHYFHVCSSFIIPHNLQSIQSISNSAPILIIQQKTALRAPSLVASTAKAEKPPRPSGATGRARPATGHSARPLRTRRPQRPSGCACDRPFPRRRRRPLLNFPTDRPHTRREGKAERRCLPRDTRTCRRQRPQRTFGALLGTRTAEAGGGRHSSAAVRRRLEPNRGGGEASAAGLCLDCDWVCWISWTIN